MVKTLSIGPAAVVGILVAISYTRAAPFVDQRSLDILFRPDNNTIRAFQNFLRGPIFGIFTGGGPLVKATRLNDLHTAIANNNASASDLPNRPGLLSSLGLGGILGGLGGGFGGLFGGGSAPASTTARALTTTTTTTTARTTTTTRSSISGISGALQLSGRIGDDSEDIGAALNVGGILSQLGTSLANRVPTTTTTTEFPVNIRADFDADTEDDSNEKLTVISLGTSGEDSSEMSSSVSSTTSLSTTLSTPASTTLSTTSSTSSSVSSSLDDDDEDEETSAGVTVSVSVAAGAGPSEDSASTDSILTRLGVESNSDVDTKLDVSAEIGVDGSLLNSVFGQGGATITAGSAPSAGYKYSTPAPTKAKPGYQYEKQGNNTFDIGVGFMANLQSGSGQVNAEADGGNSMANLGVNLSGRISTDSDESNSNSNSESDADNEVDKKPSDDVEDEDGDDDDNDDDSGDSSARRNRNNRRNTRPNALRSLRIDPREINNLRFIRDFSGRPRLFR